jgi:hypothetical protein
MSYEPTIDRTTLLEGPAHIIFDKPATKSLWKYCWCAGNVTVQLVHKPKAMAVSGFGSIDDPRMDELVEIDFTPAGNFSEALFDWMFSGVFSLWPGQSIFPANDSPVYVHTLDGQLLAVANARVTQFPAIRFGAGGPRFEGTAKITGIIAKATARTTAGALFTAPAAEAFTAIPLGTEWVHLPCVATWGLTAPLTIMTDDKGWTLKAAHQISPRYNPDVGTYDFRVDAAIVEASCRPISIDDQDLISAAIAGASRAIGQSSPSGTLSLVEDNPGLTAALYGARLVSKPAIFGEKEPRSGELTWRAFRKAVTVGETTTTKLADVDITPAA